MSFGHAAPREMQPDSFVFTDENLKKAKQVIAKYPPGRQQSAVMAAKTGTASSAPSVP